jgi:hypothetical protein
MWQLYLNVGAGGIPTRRWHKIGRSALNFDVAVVGAWTVDLVLVGVGKQEEAEAKEDDHDRCRDNTQREEVKSSAEIGLRYPGALIRRIRACIRYGGLWIFGSRRAS